MGIYAYKGVNAAGKNVKGVRDADSAKILRAMLKRDGVMVTEVLEKAEAEKKAAREIDFGAMFRRVSVFQLAMATKQLAVLLRSGIPLVEALSALIDQIEEPDLKSAYTDVRDKVNEGTSFAEALRAHPKIFENLYISMVAAGEASGTLEVVLQRLSDFLESQAKLRGKILSALAYPAIMMVVMLGLVFAMMTFVVPKVADIFEGFGAALPWYTELLMFISGVFRDLWWLVFTLIGAGVYGFNKWRETPKGRARWDRFRLEVPIFGKLTLMVAVSRFSRTLATLLRSGVPVLSAMEITKHVMQNVELEGVIEEARTAVREGESIAKPLKDSGRFPPIVTHMVAIGERSGQLEEMLENVASAYENQVDVQVTTMTSILEPLLLVVMGGLIGSIAFAILMPLMQMSDMIG